MTKTKAQTKRARQLAQIATEALKESTPPETDRPVILPTGVGAFNLKQACVYLGGISTITVHRLRRRGLLRASHGTRHLVFMRSELDRYLKETMEGGAS